MASPLCGRFPVTPPLVTFCFPPTVGGDSGAADWEHRGSHCLPMLGELENKPRPQEGLAPSSDLVVLDCSVG